MNGTFASLKDARQYFLGDRFASDNGMTLDALDDQGAVCSMELSERHRNANGGVMGGAIFTLGDFAFAAACNHRHRPTVAQQVSINFLNQPKGARLVARARCIKDGKKTCVYVVDIADDTCHDVAQFVATGYKM